jgi:predicted extracellular nuclease
LKRILVFFITNIFTIIILFSQPEKGFQPQEENYRLAFWNVENYFDPWVDSTSSYTEFNSEGNRHWTYKKYTEKRNTIYKTIVALGEWKPLAILGLAEIENEFVLNDLLANTPLSKMGYRVIHYESDDRRGIDVGVLYQPSQFEVLFSRKIKVKDNENPDFITRDILYVKGLMGSDTLHVFINHWPSRYNVYMNSEPLRLLASSVLQHSTDSICTQNPEASILIMGDFNDRDENESVQQLVADSLSCKLILLPLSCSSQEVKGTIKYQGKWDYFDHFLVSKILLYEDGKLAVSKHASVFAPGFLLEKDEKFNGVKPFRTFIGFKYNGGVSDHLPVYVDLINSR